MLQIKTYTADRMPSHGTQNILVDFLYEHLGGYGDPKEDIRKALNYALGIESKLGGLIISGEIEGEIIGVIILNKTGMTGYIPENQLVYLAIHVNFRRNGYAEELISNVIRNTDGSIALHVEPSNPAKKLYEKMGFVNKYLEMRLRKD